LHDFSRNYTEILEELVHIDEDNNVSLKKEHFFVFVNLFLKKYLHVCRKCVNSNLKKI